ncbi:MAG: hypothetical protein ACOC91_01480 [bacterium]
MMRFCLAAALLIGAAVLSACEEGQTPKITSEPGAPSAGRQARKWAYQTGLTGRAREEYRFMEKVFECAKLAERLGDSLKDAKEKISTLYVIGFEAGQRTFRNIHPPSDFESTGLSLPPRWRSARIAATYSGMALLDASHRVDAYLQSVSDVSRQRAAAELYGIMSCDAMIMLSERRN